MLLLNISPIYLRCGVLITNSEVLEKELDYYKDLFQYIKPELSINFKSKKLILFQINYFSIDKFNKSPDHEFLVKFNIIQDINLEENEFKKLETNLHNHKDSITILSEPRNKSQIPSCFYCGRISGKKENMIYRLFQKKCIRYGTCTDLSIKAIDYINNNFSNPFFSLPRESILNLVRVGNNTNLPKKNLIKEYYSLKEKLYPYILTTGDEGNCIYRIDSLDSHKKIGISTIGPTTIWSLFNLTCNYEDLEFAMKEAFKGGNNEQVDLSVGDIYGGDYSGVGLDSCLIASSFSKVNISDTNKIEKKDIGKALAIFYGVTYSRVSAMLASKENIRRIIVSGDTYDSLELKQMIQSSLKEFSGNIIEAVFCDFSNYLEVIGMVVELDKDDMI